MAKKIREWVNYEPLRSNRWLIKMAGVTEWSFKSFKLRNQEFTVEDGSKKPLKKMGLKLDLSFRHAIGHRVDISEVFNCRKITISFLDPVGEEVDFYDMDVSLDTYNLVGDYELSDILTSECSFWVDNIDTMASKFEDRETLKNYLEKKETTQ
jgi:hypothetical protein